MKRIHGLLPILLLYSQIAYAEGACPDGYYQTTPPGPQGPIGCAPIPSHGGKPAEWQGKWGAVARGGNRLGISSNMNDERTAESEAIADCQDNGGIKCGIERTYSNQCIAIANSSSILIQKNAKNKDEAITKALRECENHIKGNKCWIYYSGCSLPTRIR